MSEGTRGRPGRKPSLQAQHIDVLRAITREQPRSSLDEVTRELQRRSGVTVCTVTVRKALRQAGIDRLKPQRRPSEHAATQGGASMRVGYTDAHRRDDGPSGMNTDLTDAEWALVADLFERQGGRGAPAMHARKRMVDACCYVVRTGCAWRLLPKSFPPWRGVYKAFSRWAAAGTFEAMHDRLRQQWRDRIGRNPEPTAAIIDAQSNCSTVMMPCGAPGSLPSARRASLAFCSNIITSPLASDLKAISMANPPAPPDASARRVIAAYFLATILT
jgi:putative transposase